MTKHPLQNRWSLWFFKNDKTKNWAANLRQITTFDTVEEFWSIYNHIQLASKLSVGCDYSLFKVNIFHCMILKFNSFKIFPALSQQIFLNKHYNQFMRAFIIMHESFFPKCIFILLSNNFFHSFISFRKECSLCGRMIETGWVVDGSSI